MTTFEKIHKYLSKRKNATLPEIVQATGVNENTARKILASFCIDSDRKCRVTGMARTAYTDEVYDIAI